MSTCISLEVIEGAFRSATKCELHVAHLESMNMQIVIRSFGIEWGERLKLSVVACQSISKLV